jgi:hypothetical protein
MNLKELETRAAAAQDAGFEAVAANLRWKAEKGRKLSIAYEHFRYITEEQVNSFNEKLKDQTRRPLDAEQAKRLKDQQIPHHPTRWEGATVIHDELVFCELNKYQGLPPNDVLEKVKSAMEKGCFDVMEVAEVKPIATVVKLPDPIVFGRVNGCTDRFYVCEWGVDVSINDLLDKHDG